MFTLFGIVAAGFRLSPRRWAILVCLGTLAIALAIAWTAVKVDYRSFASGYRDTQIVVVGKTERITKLVELVSRLDAPAMSKATDELARRLAYVDFFAAVLNRVPRVIPHEGGALWWDAVSRPFMPRVFFPEKSIIDDSERTKHYSGLWIAGRETATSISIGYLGESYIDFGKIGMMVPVFALGLLLGAVYRWMLAQRYSSKALGMAMATAILYGASLLEASITKTMGSLVVTILVSWLILRFVVPRYIPGLVSERIGYLGDAAGVPLSKSAPLLD
jgi:hypothetical protein